MISVDDLAQNFRLLKLSDLHKRLTKLRERDETGYRVAIKLFRPTRKKKV